jgi:CheY-specific phosphatase CheX
MDAVKEVISIQATVPVRVRNVAAVRPEQLPGIGIVSSIGIKEPGLGGTLALCFPNATFLAIVGKMLDETYTEVNSDNADAAGELLNIIYANARVKINGAGHAFLPAIPTVIYGDKVKISHGEVALIVRVDCETDYGPFHLEVSLKKLVE